LAITLIFSPSTPKWARISRICEGFLTKEPATKSTLFFKANCKSNLSFSDIQGSVICSPGINTPFFALSLWLFKHFTSMNELDTLTHTVCKNPSSI